MGVGEDGRPKRYATVKQIPVLYPGIFPIGSQNLYEERL